MDSMNPRVISVKTNRLVAGVAGNYTAVDEDGFLHLDGGATCWDDLRFPSTAIDRPGPTAAPTWDSTNIGWLFSASATNELQIIAQFPHQMREGSQVYPHIHWEPMNTNTGKVLWRMSWRWRNNGEVAGAFTNSDILVSAGGVANKLQIDGWGAIHKPSQASGMNSPARISSIMELTLARIGGDGSDDFTGTALLKEFDIHYEIDSFGSREEFVK